MKISFHVIKGPNQGAVIPLSEGYYVVGRKNCHIQLYDKSVSSKHAAVSIEEGKVFLRDLDSKNGTFLNEIKVTEPKELKNGDDIRFGDNIIVKLVTDELPTRTSSTKDEQEKQNIKKFRKNLFDILLTPYWKKPENNSYLIDEFDAKIAPLIAGVLSLIFLIIANYINSGSFLSIDKIGITLLSLLVVCYSLPGIVLLVSAIGDSSDNSYTNASSAVSSLLIISSILFLIASFFLKLDEVIKLFFILPALVIGTLNYNNIRMTDEMKVVKPLITSFIVSLLVLGLGINYKISKDNFNSYKKKVYVLLKNNDEKSKQEVFKVMEEALKKFPDEISFRYNLANLYLESNKCEEAKPHLRILKDADQKQEMSKEFAIKANDCLKTDLQKTAPKNVNIKEQLEGL